MVPRVRPGDHRASTRLMMESPVYPLTLGQGAMYRVVMFTRETNMLIDAENLDEVTREDVLDSRDLVELMESLSFARIHGEWDENKAGLIKALVDMMAETETYAYSWRNGVVFISEAHFIEYAKEFADDIGAVDLKAGWPADCIDWEEAADQLKIDYTQVEVNGVTYYYR